MGNHMGSSPIGRTKQKNHAKAWFFCLAKAGMSLEREAVAAGARGRPPEQIPTVAQKKIDHFLFCEKYTPVRKSIFCCKARPAQV